MTEDIETRQYTDGELILAQGEPGDFVYRIENGEAEVFVRHGDLEVVVGRVGADEFLGEMGVMEDAASRSASARAKGSVTATRLAREDFMRRISGDPDTALRVIRRLSERLRSVNGRLAASAGTERSGTAVGCLSLRAGGDALGSHIPRNGLTLSTLPYVVGRLSDGADGVDLAIPDSRPYRLSRQHFALTELEGGYVVHDLDSTLGTEVNGESIGRHFGRDQAPLQPGDNVIIAGGRGSPFVFKVSIEGAAGQ